MVEHRHHEGTLDRKKATRASVSTFLAANTDVKFHTTNSDLQTTLHKVVCATHKFAKCLSFSKQLKESLRDIVSVNVANAQLSSS